MNKALRHLRGWQLLVAYLGVRGALRYERDRRNGATIDYAAIFTPDELALLGEYLTPAPWERERKA